MELWAGCVAGALEETEYRRLLAEVGFDDVEVEPTRVYDAADAGIGRECTTEDVDGRLTAAFVRARKPDR